MNHSAKMPVTERLIMENITKNVERKAGNARRSDMGKFKAKAAKSLPSFSRHSFDGIGGNYQGL